MPRVLTLPPSAPFLPRLAAALLDGALVEGFAPRGDPLALSTATVFLPTRRAGRLFAEALLEAAGTDALLLPRIVPLGDVDEDALAFAEDAPPLASPRAVSPVERRLVLASLVEGWRDALAAGDGRAAVAAGPSAALALADALSRLFDDLTTAGIPITRLDGLVPEEHDPYFKASLDFVRIARLGFSAYLDAAGKVEPAVRRDVLVEAEAQRLSALGVEAGPVIAAGSTGSLPATAKLLKTVSRLPRGAVVLPGLDLTLEDAAFDRLADPAAGAPDHPQYGLARLLRTLEITRRDVISLAAPAPWGRERLMSEALRAADTTELWATLPERLPPPELEAAMAQVSVVHADDAREEALAIAIALRETIAEAGRSAALVTPDRDLARRVAAEMGRFGLAIDDSAGTPLSETGHGRLARLIATAAAENLAPVTLFTLLSHPLARFGLAEEEKARALATLELTALRGPRPRGGIGGLRDALDGFDPAAARGGDPRRRIPNGDLAAARGLIDRLDAAFSALLAFAGAGRVPLADLVAAHRAAVMAATGALDPDAEDAGESGLAAAFQDIAEAAPGGPPLTLSEYADAVDALIADRVVRPSGGEDARLRILGPLEARLVGVDRIVLGGLAEGTWPQLPDTDPWLSRPMRGALGLDLPERRIGLAAHDFAQGFGAREVVLTLAAKAGGTPQVPSRFLQRLKTVCGPDIWAQAEARGARLRTLARSLDNAPAVPRAPRPAPAPPLALRPRRLSVTQIETLLRDPYSIYARHVLGLAPLDPLDAAPGGAERGSALHAAIGAFTRAFPDELPPDALNRLIAAGREAFAPLEAFPAEHALWWARFLRVADFLIGFEKERRPGLLRIVAETGGRLAIPMDGGADFILTARADRIEQRRDGRLAILDFKTGTAPSAAQAASLVPQLTLEAAMAARGAFTDVPAGEVEDILYVELKGGAAGGAERPVRLKDRTTTDLAETALAGLTSLLHAFENPAQGYRALSAPQWQGRHGDYDHLARAREWALGGEDGE